MSQSALKTRITQLLIERDRLWRIVRAYGDVANDLRNRSDGDHAQTCAAVCHAATLHVERVGELQRDAQELAAQLRTPKDTFAGLYLHGPDWRLFR